MVKPTKKTPAEYLVTITTTQRPVEGLGLSYSASLSVTVQGYRFGDYTQAMQALSDAELNASAAQGVPGLEIDVSFEVLS